MKINQIIINESSCGASTSGAVATIAKPLGEVQKRVPVQKTVKKKGPYANSLSESKMKDLDYDLKNMKPTEFQKKYGKKREEMIASFKQQPQQKSQQVPVKEADLHEEDKIIAVGKGHKLKPGLLNKPENSLNPTDTVKLDVPFLIRLLEYAREDANTDMDLHDLAEKLVDRGRRGKTLTMKDYEYVVDEAMSGGVVASGMPGESVQEGEYDIRKDPTYQKYNPETHTMMYKDGKHKVVKHDQVAKAKSLGWKVRSSLKAFAKGQSVAEGANVTSQIKRIKDRILQLKDWNTAGTHDKKIKELQTKLKELQSQKQGVAEGYPGYAEKGKELDAATKKIQANLDTRIRGKELDAATKKIQANLDKRIKKVNEQGVAEGQLDEKAVSKAQQRFMGMAHAIQKGKKIPGASKELKDVAKGMSKKAAHDYAATKHKGLPEKVKKKD